eukprot:1346533-Prymnesium_polylepis.1
MAALPCVKSPPPRLAAFPSKVEPVTISTISGAYETILERNTAPPRPLSAVFPTKRQRSRENAPRLPDDSRESAPPLHDSARGEASSACTGST